MPVAPERIRILNPAPVRADGAYVVHWMIMNRRTRSNPALERAAELARELAVPVLVLEAVRCDYPYASDRFHAFLLEGMAENGRRLAGRAVYHPYVERRPGEGKGLLLALARRACAVVADDHPGFFIPRMLQAAARQLEVRLEAVDGSCLVPCRLAARDFPTAFAYRRFLQGVLPAWLDRLPALDPLRRAPLPVGPVVPDEVRRRWPAEPFEALREPGPLLARLPIDHHVGACSRRGGEAAGEARLAKFLKDGLRRYASERSDPDAEATSGLSPWLHFGHLATFDVVRAVLRREGWTRERLAKGGRGSRTGYWGTSPSAEAFLDQLVTWRELGFVSAAMRPDHGQYGSLPAWARATLERHAGDPRPEHYPRDRLAAGKTGDRLWNAAQRELVLQGSIHNALRMLWGKRVLEWTGSPGETLEVLLELNDRYALDGRDPNSLSGILWCLGRYDRPWGPERPIFGTVRYMSSQSARRRLRLAAYLHRYAPEGEE
ncbi:MAG TPA: deoxyribodipyrimidine photo-lyase [Anaeromyxobacter sp.]|nr:deoxyribodipyrimidine photo-lyase [Anaeromyxobacter sp.]